MMKLISEAMREIAARPLSVVKVFWPLLAYLGLAAAVAAAGLWSISLFPDDAGRVMVGLWMLVWLLTISLIAGFTFAPVAVNWHRVVILGEAPSWRPPHFSRLVVPYALRLSGFLLGFFVILILAQLGWQTIVWLLVGEENDFLFSGLTWYKFIGSHQNVFARFIFRYGETVGELAINGLYLLILGRWMLALPATAVSQVRSLTKFSWTKTAFAMFLVYAVPIVLAGVAEKYTSMQEYLHGQELVWPFIVVAFVAAFSFLLALTVLSVAFRQTNSNYQ